LSVTNGLAYYDAKFITAVKSLQHSSLDGFISHLYTIHILII
jgi:hypothetical protein